VGRIKVKHHFGELRQTLKGYVGSRREDERVYVVSKDDEMVSKDGKMFKVKQGSMTGAEVEKGFWEVEDYNKKQGEE